MRNIKLVLLALLWVGCSKGVSVDDFCEKYRAAVVVQSARCYGGEAELWDTFYVPHDYVCDSFMTPLKSGRGTYNPEAAERCIDATRSGDCFSNAWATCELVVTGTVPLGSSCSSDYECVPTAYCDRDGSCPGTCKARFLRGEACYVFGIPPCVVGDECHGTGGGEATCIALGSQPAPKRAALGEDCTSVACDDYLVCMGSPPRCVAPKKRGDACAPNEGRCEDLTTCVDGHCKALGNEGEACVPVLGHHSDVPTCRYDLNCVVDGGSQGVCAPLLPDGAACEPFNATLFCLHDCNGGTCGPQVCQ